MGKWYVRLLHEMSAKKAFVTSEVVTMKNDGEKQKKENVMWVTMFRIL